MQNKLVPLLDKILLRKRSIIETINDFLKNNCNLDHSPHRSPLNFMVNIISGLIACREKLPSINFSPTDIELLNTSCSPIEQHVPLLSI